MISVVVPTYARPTKLIEAIKSVLQQTYTDFEIVVVDDNGIGTENQLLTEKTLLELSDDRILYIKQPHNMGGCAARNAGISASHGDYVGFLDDDDLWSPHFLEDMIKCFSSENIGVVYCDFYIYQNGKTVTETAPISFSGSVYDELIKGWCPRSTSQFLIRKSLFQNYGGFDDKLKSFQDYDLWLKLSQYTDFQHCGKKLLMKCEGVGEQVSINPVKRQAGFDYLSEKWIKNVNSEQAAVFNQTLMRMQLSIDYNKLIYDKQKKNRIKISDVVKYEKSSATKTKKIKLLIALVLGARVSQNISLKYSIAKGHFVCENGMIWF